jgi:hypothetical protein
MVRAQEDPREAGEVIADLKKQRAGLCSEANFAALSEANIIAAIALRRYHHD